jgi:hypothetical protein
MIRSDIKPGKIITLISGIMILPAGIINFIPLYLSNKRSHE